MHLYPSLLFFKKLFVTEYIYIFFYSDSLSQVFEVRDDFKKKNCKISDIVQKGGEGVRKVVKFEM